MSSSKKSVRRPEAVRISSGFFPALLLAAGSCLAWDIDLPDWNDPPRHSKLDAAFLDIEPYFDFGRSSDAPKEDGAFWRVAGQISFPGGSLAGHPLFGSIKSTFMNRDVAVAGERLNRGPLQRYWLAFGGEAYAIGRQNGTVLAGVGHNADGADWTRPGWNTEWIYVHKVTVSQRFSWGLGIDVQQYFGKFAPYPLLFIDWQAASATHLRWDADYLEARQFLTQNFSLAAGVRFNLEFFNLGKNATYEYYSAGGELGVQYAISRHVFARLNYKHLFHGEEEIKDAAGLSYTRSVPTGNSLRMNVAFGL